MDALLRDLCKGSVRRIRFNDRGPCIADDAVIRHEPPVGRERDSFLYSGPRDEPFWVAVGQHHRMDVIASEPPCAE